MAPDTRYQTSDTKTGFSLIEIMIAVFFVSVGLIGVLAFFNSSIQSNFEAKNELIAAGLAQEGAELMRNKAEFHSLSSSGDGWEDLVAGISGCTRIDYNSLSDSHPCNSGNTYICFSGNRYQQCSSGAGDLNMQRIISRRCLNSSDGSISCSSSPDTIKSIEVTCTVSWNDGSRTTIAKDRIYDNEY